jgi:drug/metabolite transporter (DMT)-like permease
MIAFAANSVLNRMGLATGSIDPASFAAIRIVAGAVCLIALAGLRGQSIKPAFNPVGTGALCLYVVGFSFAYISLDAGVGALILFGGVQVTMFIGTLVSGGAIPINRWLGAGLAFCGLIYLMWPTDSFNLPLTGSFLMAVAALGWGIYSLIGKSVANPFHVTMSNFIYAIPVGILVMALSPTWVLTPQGVALAIISGAVTSGLGYALWYFVLPQLKPTVAAVAQLTVPIIAFGGGFAFLGEPFSLKFAISAAIVLSGVAISVVQFKR